jgi:hypothetical protein
MKLTAEQKAKRLLVKFQKRIVIAETIAALEGHRCCWILAIDNNSQPVLCERPAWSPPTLLNNLNVPYFNPGQPPYFYCLGHACTETWETRMGQIRRDYRKYGKRKSKSRAEIIAIRDGVAA